MKGLLLKDLYTVKGFGKQYLLVMVFMIFWSICMKSLSFPAMYIMLLGGMLVLTTMSVDESAHFNQFALTMPVNTETLVKAKYLLLLITIGCGMIFGILVNALTTFFPGFDEGFDVTGILAIGSVFMITYAITLPIIYKFGVEKARYTYILIMLGLAAVIIGSLKLIAMIKGVAMTEIPEPSQAQLIIPLVLIDLLSVFISYKVSLKILSVKEW